MAPSILPSLHNDDTRRSLIPHLAAASLTSMKSSIDISFYKKDTSEKEESRHSRKNITNHPTSFRGFFGKVNVNTLPWPGALSTETLPDRASAMPLTMARPRPAPDDEALRDGSTW